MRFAHLIAVVVWCFGSGCSNKTVDVTQLIGRPRSAIQSELGKPKESKADSDEFTSPGITIYYDSNAAAKALIVGITSQANVEVMGARIGDSLDTVISKWGEPLSKDSPLHDENGTRLRWVRDGFRIDAYAATSSQFKTSDGVPPKLNAVRSFIVRRPDQATNLPLPEGAKEVLKKALDSWVLGDSLPKFNETHADIEVVELGTSAWRDGQLLLRYEIGPFREGTTNHKVNFAVTLVFQSRAGTEIKSAVGIRVVNRHENIFSEPGEYEVTIEPK